MRIWKSDYAYDTCVRALLQALKKSFSTITTVEGTDYDVRAFVSRVRSDFTDK